MFVMQAQLTLSVVIPVYNSALILPGLVRQLERIIPPLATTYEIILVNDGSHDESWQVIRQLAAASPCVRGITMMRNYGQHNALLCGIRAARYDVIVTMDDDSQHPPEEIPKLLAKLSEGLDVVYGTPLELPHSWWRNLFSNLIKSLLTRVMGVGTFRNISAFRAFRADLRQAFTDYNSPDVIIDVLFSWGTNRFGSVTVRHDPRLDGTSTYTIRKLLNTAILVLTGFSTTPLRVASITGFTFMFFGLLVFLYVLIVYFLIGSLPGFPFLASIISLFSGAQLFALGLFGEYLAKIFTRSMGRPPYLVGETTDMYERNGPQQ